MLSRFLLVLLACLSLALLATSAQAKQVQLAWDAPVQANGTPALNLAGYRLYYGSQRGHYPTMIPVGLETSYTVTNLSAGQTYYFAVRAYDSTGLESALSNEVSVTLPGTPPSGMLSAAPTSLSSGQAATLPSTSSTAVSKSTTTPSPTSANQRTAQTASATVSATTSSSSTLPMTASQNTPWETTLEMAVQLGYLGLLSGNAGSTDGISLWGAQDADMSAQQAFRGATYMKYLYEFFAALDEGRPLQPRHELIQNQATRYQERMALGVSADGLTYAAFLPQGGTITVDLAALVGSTVGVTWYNPLTGQYHDQGTTPGGAVRSFTSPFGASQSALVLMAQ